MIPGGWNSQREANNTQCDGGRVESTIKEREMMPGGWIGRRTPVTLNMILGQLKASWRGQR